MSSENVVIFSVFLKLLKYLVRFIINKNIYIPELIPCRKCNNCLEEPPPTTLTTAVEISVVFVSVGLGPKISLYTLWQSIFIIAFEHATLENLTKRPLLARLSLPVFKYTMSCKLLKNY